MKSSSEKPLPLKPTLRAQDSPERRGVFDAQDLTANSLNSRYPPLEPTSSPDIHVSDQHSPAPSNFQITPSLLSSNRSPNSFSTGEHGVATSTTIQSVINPHVSVKTDYSCDASSSKYDLNAPGSSRIPRHGLLHQNNQLRHGSPSRCSSSGSKINRSILRGRQTLSARGLQSLSMLNAQLNSKGTALQEDSGSDLSLTTSTTGIMAERAHTKDHFEESATEEGTQRTSSKYGFNIRESLDAREAIMGQPGSSQTKTGIGGLLSRSNSTATRRSGRVHELNLELATPNTKSQTKKVGEKGTFVMASGISNPRSVTKHPVRTPLHPPRTSSLPKTPSPQHEEGLGPNIRRPLVPKTQTATVYSSEAGDEAPPASRLSLLYRQTATSTARAAFNAKKISQSQASTPRVPQLRTLASLSDVSKSMKNLGKKVSNIIPNRRSIAGQASSNGFLTSTSVESHGPRRQASRLLTTYKNSGMEESSEEIHHRSVNIGDKSTHPEPNDRHESDGTEKEKEIWYEGTRNRAYDAETGRYVRYGMQDAGRGNEEDDERPPSRRRNRIIPDGHYVEDAAEEGRDGFTDNTLNYPSNEDDESTEEVGLPPTRRASFESNATAVGVETNVAPDGVENNAAAHNLIPDAQFDQMLMETDARARQLLNYAICLEESPVRSLMIESASHLAEGLMHTRQARIELVRTNQALDEATILLAANTHRMSVLLQEISARFA